MDRFRDRALAFLVAGQLVACTVSTYPVKGEDGKDGEDGAPGVPDNAAILDLQDKLDALQAKVTALEAQALTPDCPTGYVLSKKPFVPSNVDTVLCQKGDDEVVRVGAAGAVFWVDRYEASIWAEGIQYFADKDDSGSGSTFPKNGETSYPWLARSIAGVTPARFVTWFQARAACRAAGKRLPGREEWLTAERGTGDPGANDGTKSTRCNTDSPATGPRPTGGAGDPNSARIVDGCFSDWGAEDMVGNVWEWTDEWYASVANLSLIGMVDEGITDSIVPWLDSSLHRDDTTSGILSGAHDGDGQPDSPGLPSAAFRGGDWGAASGAGAFALNVKNGPTHWHPQVGFRCILPK